MTDFSESGHARIFALTRNGQAIASVVLGEKAAQQSDLPAISELQPVGFSLEGRAPDFEYAVFLGDVPVVSSQGDSASAGTGLGTALGLSVYWEDGLHFESTRGRVRVHLRSRRVESGEPWQERATLEVNVVPTKIGELRCAAMEDDVRRVAAGLIFDLVSKMLRGVRYADGLRAISHRSSHLELRALRYLWRDIEGLLRRIDADPELRIERCVGYRTFSGTETLDTVGIARLAARGYDPRRQNAGHAVMIPSPLLTKTSNTFEHRLILGFLRLLVIRVSECIDAAAEQVTRIENDRPLRDVSIGPGPTLYDAVDLPRVTRLRNAIEEGRELAARLRQAMVLPVFRGVIPQLGEPQTPIFRHVEAYHCLAQAMHRYLSSSLVVLEQGADERLKETSRLYEHWVFIQLADAFRGVGLKCADLQGLVRRLSRHRFTLDLDDEVILDFTVDESRLIRLRYEPWILPPDAARRRGETLCRGGTSGAAWAPDILIEFIERSDRVDAPFEVTYAVVVDSKYSKGIQEHHWSRVAKYAEIRSVASRRQVVRQIWLAYPGAREGIRCRDSAVTWTEFGPDRPRDEIIMGMLGLSPRTEEEGETPASEDLSASTISREFAMGLMRYLRFTPAGQLQGPGEHHSSRRDAHEMVSSEQAT